MNALFRLLAPLDEAVAAALSAAATPAGVEAMRVLSLAHTAPGMAVLVAGGCALLLALRDRAGALWLVLVFYSGAALNHALKHAVQRPRPGATALPGATDFAFPSGHAAQATLLYGALVLLAWRHVASRTARWAIAGLAAALVLAVAASRLVLQAHWFSDVVAGVLLGLAWLGIASALRRAR